MRVLPLSHQSKKYSREKMTKPTFYHIKIQNEIIVYDGIRLDFSGIDIPIKNNYSFREK